MHTLLYHLLRHSVLLEYAGCARRILMAEGLASPEEGLDSALVDITEADTLTLGRAVDRSVDPFGVLRGIVHQLTAKDHPEAARLDDLRNDLLYLEELPVARLRWLLPEGLDLASHRLDAWITAQATRALADLRSRRAQGLYLGAYGVVQDLRANPIPARVETLPPDEEGPLYEAGDGNAGFLHAPSMPQAATAAVLRSGYLTHQKEGSGHPLALDLSSARVRLCRWLLDGVRQGQSLGALLGYRFERGLTQRGLAQYLEAFRVLAPLGEYYKLESERIARIEAELAVLIAQQNTESAIAQSLIDGLQNEIDTLSSQITSKTTNRSSLQSQVNSLNSQITAQEQLVNELTIERNHWLSEVERLSKRPPDDEQLREAQAFLAGANLNLQEAQKTLESLKSQRDSKQSQINKLTNEINTLISQRNTKQSQLTQKKKEFDNLKFQHQEARDAVPVQVQADMQARFDEVIQRYRDKYLYPPATGIQAMETVAARQVADGLVLLEKHRAGEIPWGKHGLPPGEGPDRQEVEAELSLLEDTVDAVSDAITAENLYHTLQGNVMRAGATLDSVAGGETPPPELEFIRTSRSGVAATHRLLVLFSGEPNPDLRWPSLPRHARAFIEPHLNAWAGRLLGDPARVRLCGELFDSAGGEVRTTVESTLKEAGLCPLDIIYGIQGDSGGDVAERVRYHLRRTVQGSEGDELRIRPDRGPDWGPEELSLEELIELARAAGEIITGSRSLEQRDLHLPGEAISADEDLAELAARADAAVSALVTAHNAIDSLLGAGEAADPESLRNILLDLSHLGLPASVPRSAVGADPNDQEALLTQGSEVAADVLRRLTRLEELNSNFDATGAGTEASRKYHLARLEAVFGSAFTALVGFTPGPTLPIAFAADTGLLEGDPLAAVTWLQRMARVRKRSARLNDALGYAEAVGSGARLTLAVAQLPYMLGERWIALPTPTGGSIPSGRVSLVAHCPDGLPAGGPVAGLLVDEWVEVVPGEEETTGLAFHFDAPGTQPPQAALLVVPPDESRRWDLTDLAETVLDTLELARLRAVDPDALAAAAGPGDLLPAIYLARNPAGDTVSTDFTRAVAR